VPRLRTGPSLPHCPWLGCLVLGALVLVAAAPSSAWAKDRAPTIGKRVKSVAAAHPTSPRDRGAGDRKKAGERRVAKRRKMDLRVAPEHCVVPEITFQRGSERASGPLLDCEGAPVPETLEKLSVLTRLRGAPRPTIEKGAIVPVPGDAREGEASRGVRRLDPGILLRLAKVTERYPDRVVSVVSGYRPQSEGSLHQHGRAIDIQVEGVENTELVAFCRSLKDTGCGYYPNSYFVHLDVRKPGTGTVSWIDASGPGEPPRYVKAWPPPPEAAPAPAAPAPTPVNEPPVPAKRLAPADPARPAPALPLPDLPAAS
jgi:hypothetical protein